MRAEVPVSNGVYTSIQLIGVMRQRSRATKITIFMANTQNAVNWKG